jgi:hypothetical protein
VKSRDEILNKIVELTADFELAEESYFFMIDSKQSGEKVNKLDFIKIESEYEILKKEIETLSWVLSNEKD